jgi:hypothetical protein
MQPPKQDTPLAVQLKPHISRAGLRHIGRLAKLRNECNNTTKLHLEIFNDSDLNLLHINLKINPAKSDKCRRPTTVKPLKGSDAPGGKATIQRILARSEPRRVRRGRRKTWVEEFLVQWGPEYCTSGEALKQYYMGFDIESIPSLEDSNLTQDLLPFVATK